MAKETRIFPCAMSNKQQHINMSSVWDLEGLDGTCGLIDVVPVTIVFQ